MFSLIPSDANDPQGLMRQAPNRQTKSNEFDKLKIQEDDVRFLLSYGIKVLPYITCDGRHCITLPDNL